MARLIGPHTRQSFRRFDPGVAGGGERWIVGKQHRCCFLDGQNALRRRTTCCSCQSQSSAESLTTREAVKGFVTHRGPSQDFFLALFVTHQLCLGSRWLWLVIASFDYPKCLFGCFGSRLLLCSAMLTWPFGQIFHDITPRLQNENSKIARNVHEPQDSQMRHDF